MWLIEGALSPLASVEESAMPRWQADALLAAVPDEFAQALPACFCKLSDGRTQPMQNIVAYFLSADFNLREVFS